ncbi:MAG: hypothetical protein HWN65_10275, partial [Candidatus Helarchaeota archaeon]|nr:hypothetical protein [Candidatus Helarchaeota archaeon]
NNPEISNFGNIDSLTSHGDDPRVIISNPFEPINVSPNSHYQDFAGQSEGFKLIFLFKIFNSLLKVFPTLNELFSRENKIGYITELNVLPFEEQIDILKDLIKGNSETEIRLQLNNLMVELNTAEIEGEWEQSLPKLNYCFDLAQILDDRKFLTELFLLVIIIKCSFRGALARIMEFVMD